MAIYRNSSYYDYLEYFYMPIHFFFFLVVLLLFLIFTWYINYESRFEDVMIQFKLMLMICPVLLLLVVHWLSSEDQERVPFFISLPERDSFHRAGGSPWGVASYCNYWLFSSIESLSGTNFKKWKEQISIILGVMNLDCALWVDASAALTAESSTEQKAAYEKWEHSN
ncbi:hypothetical protein RJ640_028570 [Escallonia rubra]|uniref:Uncharacterized protein n=1 Tax=Escallonia rubra TaxID=112253 RepID=A0AA88U8R8_9ASTE|nr:hypothetical protein RJ640_028570 [Escallonia rubra]